MCWEDNGILHYSSAFLCTQRSLIIPKTKSSLYLSYRLTGIDNMLYSYLEIGLYWHALFGG